MYNIKDLETGKLLYDPKKVEELERLRKDVPEFDVELDINSDNVAKYVILMYDMESPLRKEYTKLRERKAVAAQYAGFNLSRKNEHFPKQIEQMLIGNIPEINVMIVKYLKLFNDPDFSALAGYLELFDVNVAELLKGASDTEKHKPLYDMTEKLRQIIRELTDKTFGGQDDDMLIRELYRSIESVKESLMPEFIARKLADGGDFPYNPYGDYEPEPLKLKIDEEQVFKGE